MIYNPLDRFYKSEIGAVCEGRKITFRVKGNFNSVVFILNKDGEDSKTHVSMLKKEDCFECSLVLSKGLYFYCFKVDDIEKYISLSNEYIGEVTDVPKPFQLTIYDKDYEVPKWIYGGVIYQIFPDRFFVGNTDKKDFKDRYIHKNLKDDPIYEPNEFGQVMNNDFFGGDLKGIVQKLPYLSKLGVTVIYLNPIFKAFSNHRYDTGNYMQIDPMLGDLNDFTNLIQEAKKQGIKIILDGVFNHTGDDSIYFNRYGNYDEVGAYQSKDSKYYGWYNFKNYPNEYESWWGIKTLPSVNESNQDFVNYITGSDGVIEFYTKLGIAGWRLDVVDELPAQFVEKIRSATKSINNNAIIIGEVWEDASNKVSYGTRRKYFQGAELDSVMNYPLKNAIIEYVKNGTAQSVLYVVNEQIDHYPNKVLHALMNILSTHDTYRLLSALSDNDTSGKSKKEMARIRISEEELPLVKFKLKVATLLQFTLPGVPSIYYGDEVGMQGYSDPLNRKFFDWDNIDNEILEWYMSLANLRKRVTAFVDGDFENVYADKGVFIFKRYNSETEILICVNMGQNEFFLEYQGELYNVFTNESFKNSFTLKAKSFACLYSKD